MVVGELIKVAKKNIEHIACGYLIPCVYSGFIEIDKIIGGWQNSELICIGARPSIGKTSFVISMLNNISFKYNIPALYISLESTQEMIAYKILAQESGIPVNKLKAGKIENHEWVQLHLTSKQIENAPLFIYSISGCSIEYIEGLSQKMVVDEGIKIIIIDYLQLINIEDKRTVAANREQYISIIIKKLKKLSRQLDIPIVITSQLNRSSESRFYKRPNIYDFKESGAIEEDCDVVCLLHRPEYYKIDEWDDDKRSSTSGQAEFIVAKHRNGGLDNIRLKFIEHLGKFDNLDDFESPFEISYKMYSDVETPFTTGRFPSANEAFGSDDDQVPF